MPLLLERFSKRRIEPRARRSTLKELLAEYCINLRGIIARPMSNEQTKEKEE